MMLFLLTADLEQRSDTYTGLLEALRELSAVQVLADAWVFRSPRTVVHLLEHFRELTGTDDRLMLVHLGDSFAWANLMGDPGEV